MSRFFRRGRAVPIPSLTGVLVLVLVLGSAAPAAAHALLKAAQPAVGATVAAGPQELRLQFSEAVELAFSGVDITTDDGREIKPAGLATDAGDGAILVVRLPVPLAAGSYRVHWHVVSVDTHKTQGSYGFTVGP